MSELYNLELTPGQEENGSFLPEFAKLAKFEGDYSACALLMRLRGKIQKLATRRSQCTLFRYLSPANG
jgi:hypothetical protein